MAKEAHNLDRRVTDDRRVTRLEEKITGFDVRLRSLEEGNSAVRSDIDRVVAEVQMNTRLTEEIHGKTDEMYVVFEGAMAGLDAIARASRRAAKVGRFAVRAADTATRLVKPVALGAVAIGSVYGGARVPDWWPVVMHWLELFR